MYTVNRVAIRFRWMWVGNQEQEAQIRHLNASQSAFAGCGLEIIEQFDKTVKALTVAIRFRWIWVGNPG